jgi:hypothetical protein
VALSLAVDLGLGTTRLVLAVHLLVVGAHGPGDSFHRDQPLGEPDEHMFLTGRSALSRL